eukprot:GDKJ01048111.1.p1 GENE.GDKJ01048111.1~~GDKJ01048111.1.p1  ORF type:complete len:186 (+),score=42.33 GDKJ01048111.1:49-606(+)
MTHKVLVIVADGSEEIETVCVVDILRRANYDVTLASVDESPEVKMSRGIVLQVELTKIADHLFNFEKFDAVVIPGGLKGAERIAKEHAVTSFVKHMNHHNKLIAAICAAPALVLSDNGVLLCDEATCYPSFKNKLGHKYKNEEVVVSGNFVTSAGPATSMKFALKIIEILSGGETADKVADGLLF